ncbi:MAG TPA: PIN domain-containing protein [Candidatus Acidoferrum sp.]|nr:PIN domain-containing protein [Candidatus Acidoferrum sp.]
MKLLLDTSILIDVLRARNRRRELLADLTRAGHTLTTTVLNIAELYSGMRPEEEARTESFLGGLLCYELTGAAARLAGKWKFAWSQKGHTLALADMIVAAISREQHCQLVTDNRKDFPMSEVNLYPLP